jgi:tetratricopeptide (TPR) repeat protein
LKPSSTSTFLSIALPLLVVAVYVFASLKPWQRQPAKLTAEESSLLWKQCEGDFKAGKYQQALTSALKLHESYPGSQIYIEKVADNYDRLGDYAHEAEFWEKYMDIAPNPITACPQIGQAYWKANERDRAVDAFERCLKRDPENADSIFYLAHTLEQTGQFTRSAELYEKGLKIAPEYIDMKVGLARIWIATGKTAEARKAVTAALAWSPNDVDALLAAGLAYSQEQDFTHAKRYLERGAQLSDGYLDFHIALAEIAVKQKNYPEAARQYQRILQDRPNDEDVRSKLDALRGK